MLSKFLTSRFFVVILSLLGSVQLLSQSHTGTRYSYDDLGQLVKATDSSGNVIEYVYDPVGNILQIKRSSIAAGALTVLGFSPAQGPIGQTVTIQGQAFDTTPANNRVQFNGIAATVISATAGTLVVSLPPGATSGPISVTVAGTTATSANNFTVLPVPVITAITPHRFNVNTAIPTVQVTGFNLSGGTFGFFPVFAPPALSVMSAAVDPSGNSATLRLSAGGPAGSYVLVATNSAGSSSGFVSTANSVELLDPNVDVTPPTISITNPASGATFNNGQTLAVLANASDNVDVTAVEFSVNGTNLAPGTQPSFGPFLLPFTIPFGVTDLTFGATARDAAGNAATAAPVHVSVKPDPLTTVTGKVVDAANNPISGAQISLIVQGLNAEFFRFNNPLAAIPDLTGRSADVIKLVPNVNMFNPNQMFGGDPFGVNLGMDYAVRLTGQLQITAAGTYTFRLAADEAARLKVGGTTVAEIASGTGTLQQNTGTIGLTAGAVPVEIIFVHNLGTADIQLFFTPPNGSGSSGEAGVETIVPQPFFVAQALPFTATTDNLGVFSFPGVATITGNVQATASATIAGVELSGTSASFSPVSSGITDVGAIVVAPSRWIELGPVGIAPGPRTGFGQGNYDEISNRLMVYGGEIFFFGDVPLTPDPGDPQVVWVLTHASGETGQPRWTALTPVSDPMQGLPPNLEFQSTAYDSAHNRLIVFGGFVARTFATLNDVWVLENANGVGGPAAWNKLLPQGDAPGPRLNGTAVYDPGSNSLIIFGGFDFSGFSTYSDVWVLSNANGLGGPPVWTQLQPIGGPPSGVTEGSAIYDPVNNRMTAFGGTDSSFFNFTNAVWVLTNANGQGGTPEWINVIPEGAVGSPSARFLTSAVYDQGNNRMIIFGGQPSFSADANDTWVLAGANGLGETAFWFQLSPANPPQGRSSHAAALDSASDRMVVFGGVGFSFGIGNDSWALTSANGFTDGSISGGSVNGLVTLAGGTPAADAVVRVSTTDPGPAFFKQTRTDLNGHYTIQGVPAGRTFSVRAFEPRGISFTDSGNHVFTSDAPTQAVNPSLPAAAAVKVTITTRDGAPLISARLVIQDSFKQYSRLAGFTDSDGVLVIADVPEGNFAIQAQDRNTLAGLGNFTGTVTAGDLGQTINVSFTAAPLVKKVLVASGIVDFAFNIATDTSELYDPGTGTWTPAQNAIPNRPPDFAGGFCGANMAALASGQALFAGGGCADAGVTRNAASLYLPELNQWVVTGPMAHGRSQFAMLTLNNGNALALGGCAGACLGPNILGENVFEVGNTSEVYDFQTQNWTAPAFLNIVRGQSGNGNFNQTVATLLDGRVLACNGSDGLGTFFDSCEIYSSNANQWVTTGPIGETGLHPIAVLKNGKALVVMNDGLSAKLFDPATETWIAAGPLIQKQMHGILTTLKTADVLFTGGTDDSGPVSTVQVYHPATDQWTVAAAMSTSRSGHIAIAMDDGTVLVAGGVDLNSVILNSAEIFDPVSGAWSMTGSMLQPRVGANAVVITTFK